MTKKDIVERLRRPFFRGCDPDVEEWRKRMQEAADEIERLRKDIEFLKTNVDEWTLRSLSHSKDLGELRTKLYELSNEE